MNTVISALTALRDVALNLLARLAEHATSPARAAASPSGPERRAHSALEWLAALAALLGGDRLYQRPARFIPPDTLPAALFAATPRPNRAPRALTPAQQEKARAASRLATLRRVFATVPTGTLATRLARRLGLTQQSDAWPHALTEIADPPATLALRLHPAAAPEPNPTTVANLLLRAARRHVAAVATLLAEYEPPPHPSQ